jgi:hypothetical protein
VARRQILRSATPSLMPMPMPMLMLTQTKGHATHHRPFFHNNDVTRKTAIVLQASILDAC